MMSSNYKILPTKWYQRTRKKICVTIGGKSRLYTELLFQYTYVFFQNESSRFERLIVVSSFLSNICLSKLRQLGLPMREFWRKIEWRKIEWRKIEWRKIEWRKIRSLLKFCFGDLIFLPKNKLWFWKETNVVAGFPSNIRHSIFRQFSQPTHGFWQIIEWQIFERLFFECCLKISKLSQKFRQKYFMPEILPKKPSFRKNKDLRSKICPWRLLEKITESTISELQTYLKLCFLEI